MMSEKRFFTILANDEYTLIQEKGNLRNTYLKYSEVVDLLNEQDKEIGLLRLELDTHKHPLWSTREAEKKVNKLADSLADEVKKNGLLNEEIHQLRIENMRLKKINKLSERKE